MAAILNQPYHLPGSAPDHCRLDEVQQKCLAKSAAEQFPSVAELERLLIPALRTCPPLARISSGRLLVLWTAGFSRLIS